MKKPGKKVIPTKYILSFLCVLCAGLVVLTMINSNIARPIREAVSTIILPVQKGMNQIGEWFSDKADMLKELADLQEENERLKAENEELKHENVIASQQRAELERLRELLELDDVYADYPKIAARVIGKETGNWFSIFTIDKGLSDGIGLGMNVISDGGLVGCVTYVGENYAKITTIINDDSNVSAKFASTSDVCIVQGDLKNFESGMIRVTNINIDANVKEGDMLITSQISDKYVPGILIGYVSGIEDDGNKLTKSAWVTPIVDFSQMEEVLVITQLKVTGEE
ncbi:MAG: rod shape-determining protein MreC [Lachnospiraceae bacterium]|nr:rod shape-determining protein MreC [Lachnospiraceae bacterium]